MIEATTTLTRAAGKIASWASSFWRSMRIQRALRRIRPLLPTRPRWQRILGGRLLPSPGASATRVLLATGTGSHWAMSGFESVLAAALQLRGAAVEVLLCDGVLPACQECDVRLFPSQGLPREHARPLCATCYRPAAKMFSELGVVLLAYSDHFQEEDRREIDGIMAATPQGAMPDLRWRGVAVGEHALAGALRYFGRGSLDGEPGGNDVLRLYLHAALITVAVLDRLLVANRYDVAVFHHGIYVPQGVVGDVCRRAGVRVVNWNPAYRDRTFLFSHGDTYHRTMIGELPDAWQDMAWDAGRERRLMDYLESRRTGAGDWISFQRQDGNSREILAKIGIDPLRPIIGLLTNVMWDAQLHFRDNAFASMRDWLLFTVDYFFRRPDLQLVIRVHPAEMLGNIPARQRAEDEIRAAWPILPTNISIVGSADPINTYALMQACDTALVYGTKMAIELPCWGIPMIVAGEAWARGKGYTSDVSTPEDYRRALDALPRGRTLADGQVQMARKYAYHLFLRRMIPVKFARRHRYFVPFAYDIPALANLAPGADAGLDTICRGILSGNPFVHDA